MQRISKAKVRKGDKGLKTVKIRKNRKESTLFKNPET